MPPPVSNDHSASHLDLATLLGIYRHATPGILGGDNGSIRLDLDNMPQPDAFLRIDPDRGGQSRLSADHYIEGAPELIAEIAVSSASYDLHAKLNVYRRHGVKEYIVWRTLDRQIDYFILRDGRYDRLPLSPDGAHHSETLPGLWLAPHELVAGDLQLVQKILQQGIASPEHATFVQLLTTRAG